MPLPYILSAYLSTKIFKENEKDLADIPEEVREDLTIYAADRIDEVLHFVLESEKIEDIIEVPPVRAGNKSSTDIPTGIE